MSYKIATIGMAIVASYSICASANDRRNDDRKIRETQVTYVIEHKGGISERVVVKYEAKVAAHVWQTGSASKPATGKIEDDRRCHVTIKPRVFREAYLVSLSGVQAQVEAYQAVYERTFETAHGPTNQIQALGGYHRTCGDEHNFQGHIDKADADLVAQFDALVAKDDDKTRERLRAMLKGESIQSVK